MSDQENNREVWIADDDDVIRVLHTVLVRKSGLVKKIRNFKYGRGVIEAANHLDVNIKSVLILLDLNMEPVNGWEVLDSLESSKNVDKVLVVIVSSSVDPRDKLRSFDYKTVVQYSEKPLSIECMQDFHSFLN